MIRLVRNWGAVGAKDQEKANIYPDEAAAARALACWPETQRQKGFPDP